MNVATLQCLEFSKAGLMGSKNRATIKVKPCRVTAKGQNLLPHQDGLILSGLEGKNYYLIIDNKGYSHEMQIVGNAGDNSQKWTNHDAGNLRLNYINYSGCYRFNKPKRFMLYLDNKTCHGDPCYHQFYAPILFSSKTCRVVWSNSKIMYSSAVAWSALPNNTDKSLISVQNHANIGMKNLTIAQDALKTFNGSLLKLDISCNNTSENQAERHCLLLKFRSLDTLAKKETTPPPPPPITKPTQTLSYTATRKTRNTTSSDSKTPHKDSKEKSSINMLVIAVPVSVLAVILVLTLVYFMCYRKRKRDSTLSSDQGNVSNPRNSKVVYADPNRVYDPPASSDQQEASHKYEYIDNKDIAKPKQPERKYDYPTNTEISETNLDINPSASTNPAELKYDYAANTEIPRIKLNTNLPASQGANNPAERKYDYPTNTEISKMNLDINLPASTNPAELKYDYAANTEIPRIKLNTNLPASLGANNPAERNYDYPTNTEISEINLDINPSASTNPAERKYDYPTNTEISKMNLDINPSASNPAELKYDYATNTEIPRVKLNTNLPTSLGANNPAELKYDYAINTDIPRIKLHTQPKPEDAAEKTTLEEPKKPEADQNSSPAVEVTSESVDTSNYDQPTPRESQLYKTPGKEHEYQYIYVNDSKFTGHPDNQQRSEEPKGDDSYYVSSKRPLENNEQRSEEANVGKTKKDDEVPLLYVTVTDDIQV